MTNFGYLVAAYLILWLGFFGYLVWMGGIQRSLSNELANLRDALRQRDADDAPAPTAPAELRER